MNTDIEIGAFIVGQGFPQSHRAAARTALENAGLTRPEKTYLAGEKIERAVAALKSVFALHCQSQECITWAHRSGLIVLDSENKQTCHRCAGSENSRASRELIESGIHRLVVVGGTAATREELERLLGSQIELRLVDGTHHRQPERARADLAWADRVLLWGATELHHKVSKQYSDISATKYKVVHIPRRGISQLLAGAVESMRRRRAAA
ncbi:MAG: hypothetical protein QM817_07905 [Archangium sp.]